MKYIRLLLFIVIVFIFSCEKDVEVDIPSFDQTLVANCWFTGNGEWYIRVSKTKSILGDDLTEFVDNAEVEIYEADSLVEILPYLQNGIYGISNGYVAQVNKTYNLRVRSQGYPELTASEILLEKPNILDVNIDLGTRITRNNLIGYFANIYFDDVFGSDDFYHLLVYRDFITPVTIETEDAVYHPGDTIFNDMVHFHVDEYIDNQYCHISSWFIEDKYFPDSNTPVQLLIDQDYFENTIRFNFRIFTITENYYNYGKVVDDYSSGGLVELNGLTYGYSPPNQITSNINNGYGIFASYNGHLVTIDID